MRKEMLAQDIAASLEGASFNGSASAHVRRVSSLNDLIAKPEEHCLIWVKAGNEAKVRGIPQSTVIITDASTRDNSVWQGHEVIFVPNPRRAFSQALGQYFDQPRAAHIESSARVAPSARIGVECYIGHNVVIEDHVTIGDSTVILHNSVIGRDTVIGKGSYIGSNCSIGMPGFGYEKDELGAWIAIPHVGNVVIGDGVRIHNNTCVDKAMLGSTVLSDEVKIDNLVHIAHGVKIGRNSLVIANSMVAGSVTIGEDSWIAPSVNVINQATIGSNVSTGMGANIVKNVEDNQLVVGSPAEPIEQFKKWIAARKRLIDPS